MIPPDNSRYNRLLAALPDDAWDRLAPHLELVDMPVGQALYEAESPLSHVYFPTTSVVTLLYVMEDGNAAEIGIAGLEGMVGVALLMGGESTPSGALVQRAGQAFQLRRKFIKEEFDRAGPTQRLMLRYMQALITQMSQTAVCNRHHTIDQQLSRWLLMSLDRLPSNEPLMSQDLVSGMCGTRREGLTECEQKLQRQGLITSYTDGRIMVIDRSRLEARACECYAIVSAEFERLLPGGKAT